MKLKQGILLTIKLSISLGLIAWILLRTDLDAFSIAFNKTDLQFYGIALMLMPVGLLLRAYKWQLLLRVQGANLSLPKLLKTIFISMFLNNFFLGTLGGDAYRVYSTSQHSSSTSAAVSPVLMDRITGFFSALWMVLLVGTVFTLNEKNVIVNEHLLVLVALGISVAILMIFLVVLAPRIVNLPILRLSSKVRRISSDLSVSLKLYHHHIGIIIATIGISLLFHFVRTLTLYFFILAAAGKASLLASLFISPLVGLIVMIPISINGLGIQEGAYVYYLENIGLSGPDALLVAVLSRMAAILISLIGAVLLIFQRKTRKTI